MFLWKRTYVKNWDWMMPEARHQITVRKAGELLPIKSERVSYITEEIAYWRKANAIHQWFVDNVQDGQDDCKEYYVSEDQLRELLSRCTQVLGASELIEGEVVDGYSCEGGKEVPVVEKGKVIKDASTAKELLPTQEGFFFGSTDYDQSYFADVKETKETLEQALAEPPCGDYYYSSSW